MTEEKKIRSDIEPLDDEEVEFDVVNEDIEKTTFLPMTSTPVKMSNRKRVPDLVGTLENPYKKDAINSARDSDETNSSEEEGDCIGDRMKSKSGWMLTSLTIAKSFFGIGSLAIPWGFHLCGI